MTHDAPQQSEQLFDDSDSNSEVTEKRAYWLDHKKNVDKIFYGLSILCAISIAGELLIHRHVILDIESLFAFYGIYGFVGCVGLVLAAKGLRKILMRKEDYYGDDR